MNHRPGQTKQGFFNQLNEAFAYRYLVHKGFRNVRFVREGKGRNPDIGFDDRDGRSHYCEVKTLGISNDEINRSSRGEVYDGSVYSSLSEGFLSKFNAALIGARQQICARGADGLVYIIIKFDDFTLDYYRTYRKQLIMSLRTRRSENLFIKVGVLGNRRIYITRATLDDARGQRTRGLRATKPVVSV